MPSLWSWENETLDVIVVYRGSLCANDIFRLENNNINRSIMLLKSGIFITLFVFTLQASQIKGKAAVGGNIGIAFH